MIDHYVLFQAKRGREPDVDEALADFDRDMREEPWLIELTYGPNSNARSLALGWTHGMLSRLPDTETLLNDYWNHEAHTRFMERLNDCCDTRFAVDYEVPRAEEMLP